MTIYQGLATAAFVLLVAGWTQRRVRRRHVPLVIGGIAVDLALVLILEFQRDVVGMLPDLDGWMSITHVGASVLAVLCYVPTVFFGVALLRGLAGARTRVWHRRMATAALITRAVGFTFMWAI